MRLAVVVLGLPLMPLVARAETLHLYAAGSLKAAMAEITTAFEISTPGVKVETILGASGLLRERIEAGEVALVFASADTGHP
jgi:molybdate transport system substrate-binding protein